MDSQSTVYILYSLDWLVLPSDELEDFAIWILNESKLFSVLSIPKATI